MPGLDCSGRGCIYNGTNWTQITGATTPHIYNPTDSGELGFTEVAYAATGAIAIPLLTLSVCILGYCAKVVWHNRKKDAAFLAQLYHRARFGSFEVKQPETIELRVQPRPTFRPTLSVIEEGDESVDYGRIQLQQDGAAYTRLYD